MAATEWNDIAKLEFLILIVTLNIQSYSNSNYIFQLLNKHKQLLKYSKNFSSTKTISIQSILFSIKEKINYSILDREK